jgi:hypothetical protein
MHGNGPETLVQEINKLKRRPHIVGHSSMNRRSDFAALGIRRFVLKPLPIRQYTTPAGKRTVTPPRKQV